MGNASCVKLRYSDCAYSGKDHELDAHGVSGDFCKGKKKLTVIVVMCIVFFRFAILSIALIFRHGGNMIQKLS